MGTNERRKNAGYRLLVVDDKTAIRDLLEHRLETDGFDVETAPDGQAALERLRESGSRFDAVVLDVSMPNMDGFETLRRVQELPRPPLTVMVSGRSSEREQIRAFELGAVDYVTKPFKLRVLVARLKSHLDRERRRVPESGSRAEESRSEVDSEAESDSEEEESGSEAKSEGSDRNEWPGAWTSGAGDE